MTALKKNTVCCPNCGAEVINEDDQCKVCSTTSVQAVPARGVKGLVRSGFRALKGKIRPMTAEELEEQEKTFAILDPGNPSNPIWDD